MIIMDISVTFNFASVFFYFGFNRTENVTTVDGTKTQKIKKEPVSKMSTQP